MGRISVSYDKARDNWVRSDAEKAIKLLLDGKVGDCFTISPQALNPLLKALESLGLWKSICVLPFFESDNSKPRYMVVKTEPDKVISIETYGIIEV